MHERVDEALLSLGYREKKPEMGKTVKYFLGEALLDDATLVGLLKLIASRRPRDFGPAEPLTEEREMEIVTNGLTEELAIEIARNPVAIIYLRHTLRFNWEKAHASWKKRLYYIVTGLLNKADLPHPNFSP